MFFKSNYFHTYIYYLKTLPALGSKVNISCEVVPYLHHIISYILSLSSYHFAVSESVHHLIHKDKVFAPPQENTILQFEHFFIFITKLHILTCYEILPIEFPYNTDFKKSIFFTEQYITEWDWL